MMKLATFIAIASVLSSHGNAISLQDNKKVSLTLDEPSQRLPDGYVPTLCNRFGNPVGFEVIRPLLPGRCDRHKCLDAVSDDWHYVHGDDSKEGCSCVLARGRRDSIWELEEAYPCYETTSEWVRIGGGSDITIWEKTIFETTESKEEAMTVSQSISLSTGVEVLGIGASMDMTTETSHTVTNLVSNTFGKEHGIETKVACPRGQVFQWVTKMKRISDGMIDEARSLQFVCVPGTVPNLRGDDNGQAVPKCPPTYCQNPSGDGKHAGCQCCNSAGWVLDKEKGNMCKW